MDKRKKLRSIAKRCTDVLKNKYHAKRIFLIGSLVKGIVHEQSDIDIVVEGIQPGNYMKALAELWEIIPAGEELNLIPFENAFESLKQKVLREGERVYG